MKFAPGTSGNDGVFGTGVEVAEGFGVLVAAVVGVGVELGPEPRVGDLVGVLVGSGGVGLAGPPPAPGVGVRVGVLVANGGVGLPPPPPGVGVLVGVLVAPGVAVPGVVLPPGVFEG
jgi:hypothetical protein